MTTYRFLKKQVNGLEADQLCGEADLRGCFATCREPVRERLEQFVLDDRQRAVTFEFPGWGTVRVYKTRGQNGG